jgi:hypothetical protein
MRDSQNLDSLNPYPWELEVEQAIEQIERCKKEDREQWEAAVISARIRFEDFLSRLDALLFPSLVELMHEINDFDKNGHNPKAA